MSNTTTTSKKTDEDHDDLHAIATAQRCKLMVAQSLEFDLELAFLPLMEEASAATLSLSPPLLPLPFPKPPPQNEDTFNLSTLHIEELEKLDQTLCDHPLMKSKMKHVREDLHLQIHDSKLAQENVMSAGRWTWPMLGC
ncbi:hypothetical protein Vadar_032308 [Vaccinium darrowii]|uniref:Uncharacterized protein n=1 Tax=Vaccinium darrowii TaxID=229202 RepID=A0ACB7YHY4_9ERIC|nr:hypothetical protein Vadar_032308 [Vaccinium darrowii]